MPYWAILLADSLIVFFCSIFTFWVTYKTQVLISHRDAVLCTSLIYAAISWIGARAFRTYSGVLRYSSFVDLMKLIYANSISLGVALIATVILRRFGIYTLAALRPIHTCIVFLLATLLMWALRIMVKFLFDATNADSKAQRALIYGALTGGIGLAKNIRSQNPPQFEVCGFISHEHRIKDMKLLGVPVYTLEDDLEEIIKKQRIQALLVSPARVNEFRNNQKIQDILIANGIKMYMAHEATEASVKDGELQMENMPLQEVSVEDLLPRSEYQT